MIWHRFHRVLQASLPVQPPMLNVWAATPAQVDAIFEMILHAFKMARDATVLKVDTSKRKSISGIYSCKNIGITLCINN